MISLKKGNLVSFESQNFNGSYISAHNGELCIEKCQNRNLDASWRVCSALNGRSDAISLQSMSNPGQYLLHGEDGCRTDLFQDSELFRDEASWIVWPGLAQKGISLESTHFEKHFIRHQGEQVTIAAFQQSALYKRDATWIVREAQIMEAEEESKQCQALKEFKTLLTEVTGQLAVLSSKKGSQRTFGFDLQEYFHQRHNCTAVLRSLAGHIERLVNKTGIASTVGGAAGIASGAMILGGLLAAPFTGGVSLGLTVGGAIAGAGSAATTITAQIVKDQNVKADCKDANKKIEELKEQARKWENS